MEPIVQKWGPYVCKDHNGKIRQTVVMQDGKHIPYSRLLMMNYLHTKNIPKRLLIHHINGISNDDRIENYLLIDRGKHSQLHNPSGLKYGFARSENRKEYDKLYLADYRSTHNDWKEINTARNKQSYLNVKNDPIFIANNRKKAKEYYYKKIGLSNRGGELCNS